MADIEKVKAGLRACRVWGQTEDECLGAGCPYLTEATTDDDESWQRCLEKLHRDAEEAMVPVWISVKDRLPDRDGEYVVYGQTEAMRELLPDVEPIWICNYYKQYGFYNLELRREYDFITHWMSIPKAPGACVPEEEQLSAEGGRK